MLLFSGHPGWFHRWSDQRPEPSRHGASPPLPAGRVNNSRRLTAALIFRSWFTVVKMVDFSYKPSSAIPEHTAYAAPPSQLFKTTPPGTLTREHRTDPRPSHRACLPTRRQPQPDWVPPADAALQAPVSEPDYRSPQYVHTCFTPTILSGDREGDIHVSLPIPATYPSTRSNALRNLPR